MKKKIIIKLAIINTFFFAIFFSYCSLKGLFLQNSLSILQKNQIPILLKSIPITEGRIFFVYILSAVSQTLIFYFIFHYLFLKIRFHFLVLLNFLTSIISFYYGVILKTIFQPGLMEDFFQRKSVPFLEQRHLIYIVEHIPYKPWQYLGLGIFMVLLLVSLSQSPALSHVLSKKIAKSFFLKKNFLAMSTLLLIALIFFLIPKNKNLLREKPNVLVIGLDSVRPDHVSFNGYSRKTTPHIDDFLAKSVFFKNAFTVVARTAPSWTSILTGLYPPIHGIRHMFPSKFERHEFPTSVVEAFKSEGYFTSVLSDYAGEMFDMIRFGFEEQDLPNGFSIASVVDRELVYQHVLPFIFLNGFFAEYLIPVTRFLPINGNPFHLAGRLIHHLKRLETQERPFFAVSFFSPVHLPYTLLHPYYKKYADPKYDGPNRYAFSMRELSQIRELGARAVSEKEKRQILNLYDSALSEADSALAEVFDYLAKSRLLDNTIVILLSDHGEDLYESLPEINHGNYFSDLNSDINMLLGIYTPESIKKIVPQTVNDIVRSIDIAPTLLSLCGIKKDFPMDGVNLFKKIDANHQIHPGIKNVYFETDVALNSEIEYKKVGALTYPNIVELLTSEDEYPGFIVLKEKYRHLFLRAKWRMMLSEKGRLVYIPGPEKVQLKYYGALSKNDRADLWHELVRNLLREPGTYLAPGNFIDYER